MLYDRNRRGILHSELDPEVTITQVGHTEGKTTIDGGNSRQQIFSSQSRPQPRRLRFALKSSSRGKDRCFNYRQFGHFAKGYPE